MSQQGALDQGGPAGDIETLTGNTGGPVGPDGLGNINVLGDTTTVNVAGSPGTNTLLISAADGIATLYTADTGSAAPVSGNLNVFGEATQGSETSGAGDTITITNLDSSETQKGVLEIATDAEAIAGVETDKAIVPSNLPPVFASPFPIGSVAPNTGAFTLLNVDNVQIDGNTISTTDTNGDLDLTPDGNGTVNVTYATPNAVARYGVGGALDETSLGTDGQVIIGATGGAPDFATLTSTGGTITFTPGANTLNLEAAAPAGFTWNVVTAATQTLAVNNGYITNRLAGVTYTLPSTAVVGDLMEISSLEGAWALDLDNAGQTLYFGSSTQTTGETLQSTSLTGDSIRIVCAVDDTDFIVLSSVGNFSGI